MLYVDMETNTSSDAVIINNKENTDHKIEETAKVHNPTSREYLMSMAMTYLFVFSVYHNNMIGQNRGMNFILSLFAICSSYLPIIFFVNTAISEFKKNNHAGYITNVVLMSNFTLALMNLLLK